MVRFKNHKAGRGGWSEWIYPHPTKNYLLKCCDCGLVHEVQFKTFVEKRTRANGKFEVVKLPLPIRAMFRARRQKGG